MEKMNQERLDTIVEIVETQVGGQKQLLAKMGNIEQTIGSFLQPDGEWIDMTRRKTKKKPKKL